jgi:hypothetical protein
MQICCPYGYAVQCGSGIAPDTGSGTATTVKVEICARLNFRAWLPF